MKKLILLVVAVSTMFAAVPAFAAPAENANPRAFQAQVIKVCRDMMNDAVDADMITKEQAKACVEMMKTSSCPDMVMTVN